jgi:hypothetical protein
MSKPNEQVITGRSNTGSLQEALEDAVSQVGHGQSWRLASIDGLVGGIVGNDVNVHIFAGAGAEASADLAAPGGGEAVETRQGLVEVLPDGPSICQDGAEYELVSRTVEGETRLRLKPLNGRAGSVLRRYAGKGIEVSVTGQIVHVECTRMDVVRAAEALVAT